MRFTLLLASSALAASLVLSGCSTNGSSQAIPGGSQTAMSHHTGQPTVFGVGAKHQTSCPSEYYECIEISKTSPGSQEWCIIYSGTSDCTDLYPGTWTWSAPAVKAKNGKKTKKVKCTFSPNPGNPTTLTLSTKSKKSSKGKIVYACELSVSNSNGSTLGPILIGISIL